MAAGCGDGTQLADTLILEPSQCMEVSSILGPKPSSSVVSSSSYSPHMVEFSRKRRISDSESQVSEGIENDLQGREAHSLTEKRRRDKMNTLIEKLSAMIPQCHPLPRKLDKLTVLRMAVQHLKSLKCSRNSFPEESYKPSFLQHDELRHLILRAADGFLFVVGCDRGKILFVSESVSKILKYSQCDLIGQSLFDYLHPKDVAKVKEQLSSSEITPREKLIDAKNCGISALLKSRWLVPGPDLLLSDVSARCKSPPLRCGIWSLDRTAHSKGQSSYSGLQVHTHFQTGSSRLRWGSRRSFFCRMKSGRVSHTEEKDFLPSAKKKDHRRYCTIHCTGYLRNCLSSEVGVTEDCDTDSESSTISCLVAIGRLHPYVTPQSNKDIKVKPTEFVTRYTNDGKFVYVDQSATAILGYLPQELLGTSCYEYFHQDDIGHLTDQHKAVLQSKEKVLTNSYKFKAKDGSFVTLRSQWFSFINPWTKELEYIVSINTVVSSHGSSVEIASLPGSSLSSEDTSKRTFVSVPGLPSGTVLGAADIGKDIAKQIVDLQRHSSPPYNGNISPSELLSKFTPPLDIVPSEKEKNELVQLSPTEIEKLDTSQNDNLASFPIPHSPLGVGATLDFENDENTMAALMKFFESDEELAVNEDLTDIPWAL